MKSKILLGCLIFLSLGIKSQNTPQLFKDVLPNENSTQSLLVLDIEPFNNLLYFIAADSSYLTNYTDGDHNLWVSDGTTQGTQKLINLNPIGDDNLDNQNVIAWSGLTIDYSLLHVYDGKIFFSGTDGTTHPTNFIIGPDTFTVEEAQLCATDGSASGTTLFQNLRTGNVAYVDDREPYDFVSVNEKMLFKAICNCSDGINYKYWEYDSITKMVKPLGEQYVYYENGNFLDFSTPFAVNDSVIAMPKPSYILNPVPNQSISSPTDEFFAGYNKQTNSLIVLKDSVTTRAIIGQIDSLIIVALSNLNNPFTVTLYALNKNTLAINPFFSFTPTTIVNSYYQDVQMPTPIGVINNKLYFINASTHNSEKGLWVTDGTFGGTYRIKSMSHTIGSSLSSVIVNDTIYFNTYNWNMGIDSLWLMDASSNTVTPLGAFSKVDLSTAKLLFNKVFFVAEKTGWGYELAVTSGTAQGTSIYYDLNPGTSSSRPSNLTVYDNKLFFSAFEPTVGNAIFYIDALTSSTNTSTHELSFSVYPNPASLSLKVDIDQKQSSSKKRILIKNMVGQTCLVQYSNLNIFNIDVSQLPVGLYSLVLEGETSVMSKKIQIIK